MSGRQAPRPWVKKDNGMEELRRGTVPGAQREPLVPQDEKRDEARDVWSKRARRARFADAWRGLLRREPEGKCREVFRFKCHMRRSQSGRDLSCVTHRAVRSLIAGRVVLRLCRARAGLLSGRSRGRCAVGVFRVMTAARTGSGVRRWRRSFLNGGRRSVVGCRMRCACADVRGGRPHERQHDEQADEHPNLALKVLKLSRLRRASQSGEALSFVEGDVIWPLVRRVRALLRRAESESASASELAAYLATTLRAASPTARQPRATLRQATCCTPDAFRSKRAAPE